MSDVALRKDARPRIPCRWVAAIVCGLVAAAWLPTAILADRGDRGDATTTATPEQVIEALESFGAKYKTDALGVVRFVDLSRCKIVDADLAVLDRLAGPWMSGSSVRHDPPNGSIQRRGLTASVCKRWFGILGFVPQNQTPPRARR